MKRRTLLQAIIGGVAGLFCPKRKAQANVFETKDIELPEPCGAKILPCQHKHWTIYSNQLVGTGTCLDCGEQHYLDVFLRGTAERLYQLERRLEDKL